MTDKDPLYEKTKAIQIGRGKFGPLPISFPPAFSYNMNHKKARKNDREAFYEPDLAQKIAAAQ